MDRAYVLLSGGMDSTTCLALAQHTYGRHQVTALSLTYGQRHKKEVECARAIALSMGAQWMHRDLSYIIGVGGLTDPDLEMPDVSYADLPHGISPTYVPFRNGLFLSVLASIAQADEHAVAIYYGAHAEDAENDAYPDCSEDFIRALARAVNIGTYGQISLVAPFMNKTKAEVVREGTRLEVDFSMTWSCYEGGEIHCGVCPTCRSRKEAFQLANVNDPTEYAQP